MNYKSLALEYQLPLKEIKYYYDYLCHENLYSEEVMRQGLTKLSQGMPMQYVIGNVNFYGNIINVNSDVLIPRFETELLVQKTIKLISDKFKKQISIIDLGTGSAAIAISLAKEIDCQITAVDISTEALEVAKTNAFQNKTNITFICSDMLKEVSGTYDVIISNPPYIAYDEEIMPIVKNNEPHLALYAENNGLYYYEQILSTCRPYLNEQFLIAFEIGCNQGEVVKALAYKYLPKVVVRIEKDYSNKDRYVFISNKSV